jgi:hypothetical protein
LRGAILIICTLGVLAAAFGAYLWMQPSSLGVGRQNRVAVPQTLPTTGVGGIGSGRGSWVKQFDESAEVTSAFRTDRYDRQPDGSVKVVRPEAKFYLAHGQMLHVEGKRGTVNLQENPTPKKKGLMSQEAGMPNRGELKDVTASLFDSEQAMDQGQRPVLTVTLDNLTFETETMRLYTEAAEIGGVHVEADQVPVQLRGEEYDLDGKGLVIRLNERDRRLELLEIAHGDKIVIKNPNRLSDSPGGKPKGAKVAGGDPAAVKLTSADSASAPPATAPTTKPSKKKAETIYRARFLKDVKVVQGPDESMMGDEMQADFYMGSSGDNAEKGQQKRDAAGTTGAGQAGGSTDQTKTDASAKAPTSAPTPIVIYWTGKLVVTPADPGTQLQPGQQVLRILGSPVKVHQKSADVQGAMLAYETAAQRLFVGGTSQFPMVLRDGQGATVESESVEYLRGQKIARLKGKGRVVQPVDRSSGKNETMQAAWGESCTLHLMGEKEDSLQIERAEFAGGTEITHPQIHLVSDALMLEMDPSPSSPAGSSITSKGAPELKHMLASGKVTGHLKDSSGKPESILCERLEVLTAKTQQGQLYAQRVIADGKVKAFDAEEEVGSDQEMEADHLVATLAPVAQDPKANATTKASAGLGSVKTDLQDLLAQGNVHVRSKDGGNAAGNELKLWVEQGQPQMMLSGAPARVDDKTNSVVGNLILVHGGEQRYEVRGPGKMHFEQKDEKKATTRPVDVAWEKGVDVNGKTNLIAIDGGVVINSVQSDGTLSTTNSNSAKITLRDRPMKPGDKPKVVTIPKPGSGGLDSVAGKFDAIKDKEAKTITFLGDAQLQAVQPGENGALAMQFNLLSSEIRYDTIAEKLTVPAPGKILFVDRRTPRKDKPPAKDANTPLGAGANSPGMTAMRWSHELVFDQLAGLAVMDGDVFVKHEPDDPKQQAFELNAKRVQVETAKKDPKAKQQQPAAAGVDQVGFRRMQADGGVQFGAKGIHVEADSAEYDPVSAILVVRGTDRVPGQLYDEKKQLSKGSFKELYWNTKTEQIDRMEDFRANARQ